MGAIVFGVMAALFTVLTFMFPFAWLLYLPLAVIVWGMAFLFFVHGLRPR